MLRRELASIDRACSRFRDDSELNGVNRAAAGGPAGPAPARGPSGGAGAPPGSPPGTSTRPSATHGRCGYDRDFSRIAGGPGATPRVRVDPRRRVARGGA